MRLLPHRPTGARLVAAGTVAATVLTVTAALAPTAPATASPPTPAASGPPAAEQAAAKARATGTAVAIEAATTATSTLTANPDGSLTQVTTPVPVRTQIEGTWHDLDATLRKAADGSITTTATSSPLHLSGGGTGPMATMGGPGRSLTLTMPMTLPAPTLAGPTATYPGVLPGVDLQITADPQGGFSHRLVVHDATAAADPALRAITLGVHTDGVALTADAAGNLRAADRAGRILFSAPAPIMWDTPQATAPGAPQTAAAPGSGRHTARVATTTSASSLQLVPDQAMLAEPDTHYPVIIDPTWSASEVDKSGWATVAASYPDTKYWNSTPDARPVNKQMQAGNADGWKARTLINFSYDLNPLYGATINSATVTITATHSYSCTPKPLNLYAPSTVLTASNASWNSWKNNFGNAIRSVNVAKGYSSSCPAGGIGFDVADTIRSAVSIWKGTQTFGLATANESDTQNYHEFEPTSPRLTITYNHTPGQPTGLRTSPSTDCNAATPTNVGDGTVNLYAPVTDHDPGSLDVYFHLARADDPNTSLVSASPVPATPNTTAVLTVDQETLAHAAQETLTTFVWKVRASDGLADSPWSQECKFRYDPTRTGQPTVADPAQATIGTPVTVHITRPNADDQTIPSGYLYQINSSAPLSVPADADGSADIEVTPTRSTNTLTVTSTSAGGNIGQTATIVFNAAQPTRTADQDLTGDGRPDPLIVGNTHGLPAGLWLGNAASPTAPLIGTNIGVNGTNATTAPTPSAYDASMVVVDHFSGNELPDILVYHPTGTSAGHATLLRNPGDGSVVLPPAAEEDSIEISLTAPDDPAVPLQVASGGNLTGKSPFTRPDLFTITGSAADGAYLNVLTAGFLTGSFTTHRLATLTPPTGTDWTTWTISTCQLADASTAMFLWQQTTGALYLWTNVRFDTQTQALNYTQTWLSETTPWNTGAALSLQAADINTDGTPRVDSSKRSA